MVECQCLQRGGWGAEERGIEGNFTGSTSHDCKSSVCFFLCHVQDKMEPQLVTHQDVTFQSVKAKNITTKELMTAAFGDTPRTTGMKSAMLRVLKEVEEGEASAAAPIKCKMKVVGM